MISKAEATEMLLTSEFGQNQLCDRSSGLYLLARIWHAAAWLRIAGCECWLEEMLEGSDRLGKDWSWVAQPHVMYCSQECTIEAMATSKPCLHVCDCCGDHDAIPMILQIKDVALMTSCCKMCAALPEAFAHLN